MIYFNVFIEWFDPRLKFKFLKDDLTIIEEKTANELWLPELQFMHEFQVDNLDEIVSIR